MTTTDDTKTTLHAVRAERDQLRVALQNSPAALFDLGWSVEGFAMACGVTTDELLKLSQGTKEPE